MAQDSPRESCAEVANLAADNKLAEIPAAIYRASKGAIELEQGTFRNLQPVVESGPVKVNDFLIEKNYNDTMLKIWHVLYFDWQSLYLRCTYLKVDGEWIMTHINYETDEEDIDLP